MKTAAFRTDYYICPNCEQPNTIRRSLEYDDSHCRTRRSVCSKCSTEWTMHEINEFYRKKYGRVPLKFYNHFVVEFICDECGRANTILPDRFGDSEEKEIKVEEGSFDFGDIKGDYKTTTSISNESAYFGLEYNVPSHGTCICGQKYKLFFPMSETQKQYLQKYNPEYYDRLMRDEE